MGLPRTPAARFLVERCIFCRMLISTPAIVLHAFPYGETSKIVRLATREHGVQSGMAKGANRVKSRFGASLQVLSEGTAQLYLKPHRDLHTLSGFDVTHQRSTLAADLRRYAAAMALAELVLRFAPAEPHPALFDVLAGGLDRLEEAAAGAVEILALAALWQTVAALGFAPSLDACARCGADVGERAAFSHPDGGYLCARCGAGMQTANLGAADAEALHAFVTGDRALPADVPANHLAAHRRLFARFVRRHVAEERELPALAFWEGLG